jgi:NAD+ synthase
MTFSKDVLRLDCAAEVERIGQTMRRQLREIRRQGVVLGLSGGIDSSVTAALAVRALGARRVFGLFMPEADSDPESLELGQALAAELGIKAAVEDIAPALTALRCYERRNAAVAAVIPGFTADWKFKIVLPGADHVGISYFCVVARSPEGREVRERLPVDAYLAIVAATNFKQRVRKMVEYHWADRLVKQGDGAADLKPIAHLYKTQVYELAAHLGLPESIRRRPPTTDTYSLPQGQDEFYFNLSYDKLDLCLYGKNHGVPASEVAAAAGLTPLQVERAYHDIDMKRSTTRYQHLAPLLVEPVAGVG